MIGKALKSIHVYIIKSYKKMLLYYNEYNLLPFYKLYAFVASGSERLTWGVSTS